MRYLTISMVVLVASLAAQDSRPAVASTNLAPSIVNLDHESYDVRAGAMFHLRSEGEAARPYLEKACKDFALSLEARGRAEALLKELDAKKSGSKPNPVEPMSPERIDDATAPMQVPTGGSSSTSVVSGPDGTVEVRKDHDGIRLTVKPRDGSVSVYQAKDIDTFKKEHPEVYEKYKHMGLDSSGIRVLGSLFGTHRGLVTVPESSGGLWRHNLGEIKIPDMPPIDKIDIERLLRERLSGADSNPVPWVNPIDRAEAPTGRQLGVIVEKVPALVDRHLKLGGVGVVIVNVLPNSLAQKLGLQVDDIVKSVDGMVIHDVDGIRKALNPKPSEKPSEKSAEKPSAADPAIEVIRNGDVIKL